MNDIVRRNASESRKAINEWWDNPKHKQGSDDLTTSDDPDDPKNHEAQPKPIKGWRETPDGWVEED